MNGLNMAAGTTFSVQQCKDKLKWLRKKWVQYKKEDSATGNVDRAQDPPCLDLMVQYWHVGGLTNTTLLDDDSIFVVHSDEEKSEDFSPNKKKKTSKTNGEAIESGELYYWLGN